MNWTFIAVAFFALPALNAEAPGPPAHTARFQVVPATLTATVNHQDLIIQTAIRWDTATGQAWFLTPIGAPSNACQWYPIKEADSPARRLP